MLSTLLKLGEQLSKNLNEWDDIIDIPNTEKEKAKEIKLYVAELIFNLNQKQINIAELTEYDDSSPLRFKNIRIQGGNNKAIYVCAEAGKLEQIKKTLFGKDSTSTQGEFIEAIDKDFTNLRSTQLYTILANIYSLRDTFLELYGQKDEKGKEKSIEAILQEKANLSQPNKIILWYASVLDSESGITTPTPINQLSGYDEFIRAKFLNKTQGLSSEPRISYASGKMLSNTTETDFTTRYSINKMFVKETKNYASGFDDNNFGKNYQLNIDEQLFVERASKRLLEKYQVKIAGIDHCIIPQFLNHSSVNTEDVLSRNLKKSEFLFQSKAFGTIQTEIKDYIDNEIYWITFLGFESDGNFFKTINTIQDVSSSHFTKVIQTFSKIHIQMSRVLGPLTWESIMTDFVNKERIETSFNLQTIYYLIPQRKDKEKKNEALGIFKSILEQRKLSADKLFSHFCSLTLCHYYPTRYEAYKNVRKYGDGAFDFAVRDTVFKYQAFIQVLKQLNLLDSMENMEENDVELLPLEETSPSDFGQRIEQFFQQMQYSPSQKAMFYLGRMLSTVAYIQKDKKKTVLEKVNFNGMDKSEIQRLRNSLIEKAKQYSKVNKVIFTDGQFTQHFDFNNWQMPEQEAVFFLLSGYSFGVQTKEE